MSLRAHRAVTSATQVAYFRKAGRAGQARRIVTGLLRADAVEHAMEYPVTTELPFDGPDYNDALARFYDEWAARLQGVAQTSDVVVLCEGDPFFYGSFMHLYSRLSGVVEMEVIPGITGMSGCWTSTGQPITWGDDVLSVLMGTLPEEELVRHMAQADALVVMKTGRNLPKIRRALDASGRLDAAWLVEAGTMPNQRIQKLTEANIEECPYFAIVLVHGHGRRPEVVE
jgi:precorrin-2/cobalt-factor-2 C20-methyltransferase